jgi:hypothetical protein
LVTKYAPEELLTKEETQTLLDNIAKKEKEFWGRIGS